MCFYLLLVDPVVLQHKWVIRLEEKSCFLPSCFLSFVIVLFLLLFTSPIGSCDFHLSPCFSLSFTTLLLYVSLLPLSFFFFKQTLCIECSSHVPTAETDSIKKTEKGKKMAVRLCENVLRVYVFHG